MADEPVQTIRRILVPVDFSECSRSALEYAVLVALKFGAEIDVLHVWEPPGYIPIDTALTTMGTGPPQTLGEIARAEAGRDMQELLTALDRHGLGRVDSRIESGDAVDVILQVAERDRYDLIAMGTHGRTGFRHLLMGSVAERVRRRASCPVLTVRGVEPESGASG